MAGKFGGYVANAQMATCIAGRRPLPIMAGAALSAAATKFASETLWSLGLLRLHLNGTMEQMTSTGHFCSCLPVRQLLLGVNLLVELAAVLSCRQDHLLPRQW